MLAVTVRIQESKRLLPVAVSPAEERVKLVASSVKDKVVDMLFRAVLKTAPLTKVKL